MRWPVLHPVAAIALVVATFFAYGLVAAVAGRDAAKIAGAIGVAVWTEYVREDAKRHGRSGWWCLLMVLTGGLAAPLYCWYRDFRGPTGSPTSVADQPSGARLR